MTAAHAPKGWLNACDTRALVLGRVLEIPLPSATDRPLTALLVRDGKGCPRAYLNLCQHLPIPLDAGGGRFLSADGSHLVCQTHGAAYRLSDGVCERGPCLGKVLVALLVQERAGRLFIKCP
ncbi:MAG: Rieske 2Fe-2S domain-containing protein [Myxococcales bacterium]|nr:Rieske 2Fe-2S domain-containing protein [Myxococcales bacterium]